MTAAAGRPARDYARIIEALEAKTVERGCTPGEAAAARAKLDELRGGARPAFPTIKACILHHLRESRDKGLGLTHAEIARRVRRHFPNASTTADCVAWYSSRMRRGLC